MSRDTTIDLSSISPMMVTKATLDKRGTVLSQVNPVDPTAKGILATLRLYEMFTVPFPAKAVRVGDSWTTLRNDTIPMPTGGGTLVSRVELKHTFRGVRDTLGVRCWVIETVSTTLEQSGSVTTAAGDFALDGTGQVTNRAYLEAGTGITMALSSESTVQLQMAITGQQSMVIPLDMQTRLTAVRRMPSR